MPRRLINRSYFARRAEQSRIAMAAAEDPGARLAHQQLQSAYELLARPAETIPAMAEALPVDAQAALANWTNEGGSIQ